MSQQQGQFDPNQQFYPQGYVASPQPNALAANQGFVPVSPLDPYIGHPSHPSAYAKLPEENIGTVPVTVTPFGLERGSIEDEILAQDYEVNIPKWFSESWAIYKQHWIAFTLFTIFQIAVGVIPYVGSLIAFPLGFGIFLAVTNKIRYNGIQGEMRYDHLLFGFLFFVPLLMLAIIECIALIIGFLLCIIPGLYLLIALSFACLIFMEYHDQNIGILGSMILSMKVVNKHLCEVTLFLIVNALFMISGILLLGVGLLITIPIGSINLALAFKDLFGLNPRKEQERNCVMC